MSHPPTSLGGKRSPGFQPHRQACHLTTSESEEEPPSDQYLLSVFTVFSLKKKNNKKMGKRNHSKEQKEKNPAQNQRWILFRIFFIFIFFYLPMARRWDTLGTENPVPSRSPPPTTFRLPEAPRYQATLTGCHGPTQPPRDLAGRDISALELQRVLTGPREVARGAGGMDRLVRGRSCWVFVSLGTLGDQCRPHHPEMKVTNFLCWAFASASVSVRVPSLPPHRDLEEWGGEAVGLRVLVGVCMYLTSVSQDSSCPARLPG